MSAFTDGQSGALDPRSCDDRIHARLRDGTWSAADDKRIAALRAAGREVRTTRGDLGAIEGSSSSLPAGINIPSDEERSAYFANGPGNWDGWSMYTTHGFIEIEWRFARHYGPCLGWTARWRA